MFAKLRHLRQDDFLRHNAIFFAGNLSIGVLNYLFYPILGRLLAPSYFGEVQTLFSLFSHIGVFFNVLGLVVVNIVANQATDQAASQVIIELEKFALFISTAGFVLFLFLAIPLEHFFQFGSAYPFVGLAIAILISVPITFRRAVLQGIRDFAGLSWAGIVGAAVKLVVAIGLVLGGYKTGGAVAAVLVAQLLTLLYVWWRLRQKHSSYQWGQQHFSWPKLELIAPELKYAGLVLSVSLIITIQYTIDILTVKHYFPAHQAGLYAGVSTIANIIFFVAASVSGVLIASVKIGHHGNKALLKRSLILTSLLAGGALVVFAALPHLVTTILIGSKYASAAHYLPSIAFATFLISIANLLFIYHLAQRAYTIAALALGGSALTIALMLVHHPSIQAIIGNVIIGSAVLLASVTVFGFTTSSSKTRV